TDGGLFLLQVGTDVGLFLLPAGTNAAFGGFTFFLKEKLESSLVEFDLGAEAKGSLVLELEDLTLETQDAKPVVSESEDLLLLS
ncbi:hypothetical protein Tco_0325990, partial [Tanacetum coccineum]